MFQLPKSSSAFQYECTIVQPEPVENNVENNYMEDETVVIKKKKNNRLPGEKLLKQLYRQEMKEREKKLLFNERMENSISSIMNDLSLM